MTQGMEHLPLQGQAERAGAVHPGEEKAPGRPTFQYLEGVVRKKGTDSSAMFIVIG